eukprot:768344-Hanusia_phi.AAC.13
MVSTPPSPPPPHHHQMCHFSQVYPLKGLDDEALSWPETLVLSQLFLRSMRAPPGGADAVADEPSSMPTMQC